MKEIPFDPAKINCVIELTRKIVKLVVERDFAEIDQLTGGKEICAKQLLYWIDQDHVNLTLPPERAFEFQYINLNGVEWNSRERFSNDYPSLFIFEVNSSLPTWSIDFLMWSKDGQTDYTLNLTITEDTQGQFETTVNDLHVQ